MVPALTPGEFMSLASDRYSADCDTYNAIYNELAALLERRTCWCNRVLCETCDPIIARQQALREIEIRYERRR